MRRLLKSIKPAIVGFVLPIFFTSCVETKLRHLGYTYFGSLDPKVDYSGWGRDHSSYHSYAYEGVDLGPSFPKFVYNSQPSKSNNYNVGDINMLLRYKHSYFREHSHQMLRDYQYAIFCPEGYVSEMDIRELRETLHDVTARTLLRMFAPMVEGEFIHDTYSKNFTRILSDAIKDTVMAVKIKDNFSDPGGWQLFKPIEGLDKQEEPHNPNKYLIGDMGDGWYKIFSPFSRDTISVKVAFAGKYLNSIIIGLKNEKKGVDILDTNYNTSYNNQMLTFTPMDDLVYTYMVMNYICPIVYKETGRKKLITEEDFSKVTEKIVAREKAFVHEFYDAILSSGNDIRKIQKKYRYQLVREFAARNDEKIKAKYYGADLFLPCSFDEFAASGYTVEYVGEDCFRVTIGGNSVFLKVVLYGNKMTPAIMGMINPSQDIDYCPDRFSWAKSVKGQ